MKNFRKNQGITLIALVITVIVLLILAGVSIATLTGDNGLLSKAQQAKEETEKASDRDKIAMAVSEAQIGEDGYQELTTDNLENELIKDGTKAIVSDNEDGTKHILFLDEKKEYKLDNNGNIEDLNIDFNTKYVAPPSQDDSRNEGVIGIGTDGQPVDMDLWEYNFDDVTNGYGLNDSISLTATASADASKGYNGADFDNIVLPQYISIDKGENWTPVTNLNWMFFNCTNLKQINDIPTTVVSMRHTFRNCSSLISTPIIPDSVTNIGGAFYGCTNLTTIQYLSKNATNMQSTFNGCTSLTGLSNIPDAVTNMYETFANCNNLISVPTIPNNVIDMHRTFFGCSRLTTIPNIPNKVENLQYTFANCTSLVSVPTIPNSVINMNRTFYQCSSLTGVITINANLTGALVSEGENDYYNMFRNAATNEGCSIKLTGTCSILQDIITATNKNNITLL